MTSLKACGTTQLRQAQGRPDAHLLRRPLALGGNLGARRGRRDATSRRACSTSPGAGWFDILENTGRRATFQCPLVDASDRRRRADGRQVRPGGRHRPVHDRRVEDACPAIASSPAIGRWILDPADPANFGTELAPRSVPAPARRRRRGRCRTSRREPRAASPRRSAAMRAAACRCRRRRSRRRRVLLAAPNESQFLDYLTVAPGDPTCPPGNTFAPRLAAAAAPSVTGLPATRHGRELRRHVRDGRLQTDAIYFLLSTARPRP